MPGQLKPLVPRWVKVLVAAFLLYAFIFVVTDTQAKRDYEEYCIDHWGGQERQWDVRGCDHARRVWRDLP